MTNANSKATETKATRVAYMRDGQLRWAPQAPSESPLVAVTRSCARHLGPNVQLWWQNREDGHDVYNARWYDERSETFRECEVKL